MKVRVHQPKHRFADKLLVRRGAKHRHSSRIDVEHFSRAQHQHGFRRPFSQGAKTLLTLLECLFCVFALADVKKTAYVMGDIFVAVSHGRNRQQHGKYLTILASIPNFTTPGVGTLDAVPHTVIERWVMDGRPQYGGFLAKQFIGAVPCDTEKGLIDRDDALACVGDHDPLAA